MENNTGNQRISARQFLPGIAWFCFVLILLCLPGEDLPKADNWMQRIYFDKWVHTFLFGTLSFLFMQPVVNSGFDIPRKRRLSGMIAASAILWGITTEFIQLLFISGRSFDLGDWAGDSTGAILALIINLLRLRA